MKNFVKIACIASIGMSISLGVSAGILHGTQWQSVHDKTGAKKAVIEFTDHGGVLSGRIIKLNDPSRRNAVCDQCKGNLKNVKFEGMRIIWGLKPNGKNKWRNGHLVDPQSGRIYKGKLTLQGDKLKLRSYVGVAVLGRSQTWIRVK